MKVTDSKPHVVLLCSPGLGHLIPIFELGKCLVKVHNFEVTIFVVPSLTSPAETQILQSATTPKLYEIIELPPVDISGLIDPGAAVVTQLCVIMREIKPGFRSALLALKFRPAAIIVDLFGTESLAVAKELEIPNYVYVFCSAWFVALSVYMPTLHKVVEGEYTELDEPLKIPGCIPVRPEDVVDPMLDRTNQQYLEYVRLGGQIPTGDGILINTWEDLQHSTLAAFRDENLLGRVVKVPVYPIGPLRRTVEQNGWRSELFDWLDKQPKESVIYVSFGSGGTLSVDQMTEVAWGLELSQQRFIWVVRPPTIKTGDGSFFTTGNGEDDVSRYLPDGFLSRTQKVGLVVPQWAPQVSILSHPSVAGFLSHSGWNSTLESITNGVPMIVWPLYAEQRLNATFLTEELGVAVRPKILPSKEAVKREEIGMMIRRIMIDEEGIIMRNKVKELKYSAEKTLSEGGSSYNSLAVLAKEWENSWKCQKMKAP